MNTSINRRNFIKALSASAAALTGMGFSSRSSSAKNKPNIEKLAHH